MGYGSREMWREDFMSMMDDEYDEPVLFDEFSSYAAKYESFEGMYPVAVYEETKEGFGSDSTWPEDLEEKVSRRKQKPDDGSVSDLPGFMRLRDFNLPDTGTGKVKKLKRDLRMEALKRIEDSARTVADFNKVIEWHDALDANERSRVRKHELYRSGDDLPLDYGADENGDIFPAYLGSVIARQMRQGDFLDYLYCSPETIDQLTTTAYMIHFMRAIKPEERELFFFRAIEGMSAADFAEMKGQTDRGVRKSWKKLDHHLKQRTMGLLIFRSDKDYSFTGDEQNFLDTCREKYEYKPGSEDDS